MLVVLNHQFRAKRNSGAAIKIKTTKTNNTPAGMLGLYWTQSFIFEIRVIILIDGSESQRRKMAFQIQDTLVIKWVQRLSVKQLALHHKQL